MKRNIQLDHELSQSSVIVLSHSGPEPGAGSSGSNALSPSNMHDAFERGRGKEPPLWPGENKTLQRIREQTGVL